MKDDAELLRQFAEQRSDAAFAELVNRHLPLVYSAALRQLAGDTHLAQDAAQIVFSTLARKAASLSDQVTLAGWLYLSAHHAAAQLVRGEQRRRVREQKACIMNELSPATESDRDWAQVRPVLDEAMKELSAADREAVLLRYFERRPFSDIGAMFSLSEDAARMRVDRALDKLRVLLSRRGITSTTAALGLALANQAVLAAPAGMAATITGAALSSAAATAATATAFSTGILMTKTSLAAALVALIAIGSAIYFLNETQQARTLAADATRERDELRAKMADAQRRATQAGQQAAAPKPRNVAVASSNAPAPVNPGTLGMFSSGQFVDAIGGSVGFKYAATPASNAEARRRMREFNAQAIESTYAALFRRLKFAPEQIEQFKNLKLDSTDIGDETVGARIAALKAENPNIDRDGVQKMLEQMRTEKAAEFQEALRTTFGPEAYENIQSYEGSLPLRSLANRLASALFYSDSPLTVSQAEQLVDLMGNQSQRDPRGQIDAATMDPVAVLDAAQAILSPAQLAAFRQLVTQRVRTQLDQERYLDERKGAGAGMTVIKSIGD